MTLEGVVCGDCRDVLAMLPESSVDCCITDPPYHLTNVVYDYEQNKGRRYGKRGFMAREWDGGGVAFQPDTWRAVWRVLKPGAHLLAFGGTRTEHRLACAIEDAGFEVRDKILWLYAEGFPKSHDISKAIDRAAGEERGIRGWRSRSGERPYMPDHSQHKAYRFGGDTPITAPATPEAALWDGFGTALKPACEVIVVARKPLGERSVAQNCLRHGTGAVHVDAGRVGFKNTADEAESKAKNRHGDFQSGPMTNQVYGEFTQDRNNYTASGRWPANVVLGCACGVDDVDGVDAGPDGSTHHLPGCAVRLLDAQSGESTTPQTVKQGKRSTGITGIGSDEPRTVPSFGDSGGASRFYYVAKASAAERVLPGGRGVNRHVTLKPLALLKYLVGLFGGNRDYAAARGWPAPVVLDPFCGSGTTLVAAHELGFRYFGIEADPANVPTIAARLSEPMLL